MFWSTYMRSFSCSRSHLQLEGLTIQANMYYKMLIGWTSQKIKEAHGTRNAFDFKHVCPFDRSFVNATGPCVLFATPGMISGGFSLEVFKQWAPSEKNLVTLPGYCVAGTVGHKLMSGKPTRIDLDKDTSIDVRCQIHQLSFSPHTDAKGIMDLVGFLSPKNVVLVHGEKPKMSILKGRIQSELGIPCFDPANNESVSVPSSQTIKVDIAKQFFRNCSNLNPIQPRVSDSPINHKEFAEIVWDEIAAEGILLMEKNKTAKIVSESDLLAAMGAKEHMVQLACCCPVKTKTNPAQKGLESSILEDSAASPGCSLLELLSRELKSKFGCRLSVKDCDHLELRSFRARICANECCGYRIKRDEDYCGVETFFCCSWLLSDDVVARKALSFMKEVELDMSNKAFLIEM